MRWLRRICLAIAALVGCGAWVRRQPVGTRSLLIGSHQFALHPAFVLIAWRKLYKAWPDAWRIYLAIALHDVGYAGLGDMDGAVGETHPLGGARLAARIAGGRDQRRYHFWYEFTAGHSRSYARRIGIPTSPLMRADKLATALYPRPLYALLCWLSGEWVEYKSRWIAAGTYPGSSGDGVWAWCGHLQANWSRFKDINAVEGRAYGNE